MPAAIRATKAALRRQIGDVHQAFSQVESLIQAEVADVGAQRECGEPVWPVVQFSDIAAGTVPADLVEAVRRWEEGTG